MSKIRDDHPAEKRGADELMNRAEFALRNNPRALRHARKVYLAATRALYGCLERHFRRREGKR
jgi:hypothetical protein